MRLGVPASTLLLIASVATAQPVRSGQRPQPNMRPASPQSTRPAPPPPMPPPAPRPVVVQPTITPQAPAPFVPTPQPQARTPFDATPRTYAPRYDGRSRRRYGPPYYSSAFGIGELATGSEGVAVPDETVPPEFLGPPRLTSPVVEPQRVVVASHGPDTYYVIPGCYAGNRRPEPQRLPKGCDAAKLKATPVR